MEHRWNKLSVSEGHISIRGRGLFVCPFLRRVLATKAKQAGVSQGEYLRQLILKTTVIK